MRKAILVVLVGLALVFAQALSQHTTRTVVSAKSPSIAKFGAAGVSGKIDVVGDYYGPADQYDPVTDIWHALPNPLLGPTSAAAELDGVFYALSSNNWGPSGQGFGVMQAYTPTAVYYVHTKN